MSFKQVVAMRLLQGLFMLLLAAICIGFFLAARVPVFGGPGDPKDWSVSSWKPIPHWPRIRGYLIWPLWLVLAWLFWLSPLPTATVLAAALILLLFWPSPLD